MESEVNKNDGAGMTDEELAARFQSGDDKAAELLLEKYTALVKIRARALYLAGGDRDDLLQEGMIGLFKAVQTYRQDQGASFQTYASVCVSRQMYKAVESSARQKHRPLNDSVSIDTIGEQQVDRGMGIAQNPEVIVLGRESEDDLFATIRTALSAYEQEVLNLYLQGMDYHRIAKELGRPEKSVDNALQRIRTKLQKIRE
jgi:RNA polymerase sporulation-specific sigma factor